MWRMSALRGEGSTSAWKRSDASYAIMLFPPPHHWNQRRQWYWKQELQGVGQATGGWAREGTMGGSRLGDVAIGVGGVV